MSKIGEAIWARFLEVICKELVVNSGNLIRLLGFKAGNSESEKRPPETSSVSSFRRKTLPITNYYRKLRRSLKSMENGEVVTLLLLKTFATESLFIVPFTWTRISDQKNMRVCIHQKLISVTPFTDKQIRPLAACQFARCCIYYLCILTFAPYAF